MSRGLSRWQALLLGVVVLGLLVAGGFGLFAVGDWSWFGRDSLHVRVAFPEIRGVEVGTRVRAQGIDAGEVVEIQRPARRGDPVVLRLRLKPAYRQQVYSTDTVSIVSEGMLGGKVVELLPGQGGAAVAEDAFLTAGASNDADGLFREASATLRAIQDGKGTLGKLATEDKVHQALLDLLQQGKTTLVSIQRVGDSIERMPLVGGYITNPVTILDRPGHAREQKVVAAAELFEPGRAVLTEGGKRRLDDLAPWLLEKARQKSGTEVAVASFADPSDPESVAGSADVLTRTQSLAVCDYLKKQHGIHKVGWFGSRKVTPVGLGTQPSPVAESGSGFPAGARVEIIVFVPQS